MRPLRVLAAAALAAAPLTAQDASPYVPLRHWGMPFVEHLIAAGRLADPTPLTRPLRAADLARALADADTLRLSPGERGVVRRLAAELAPPAATGPWVRVEAHAGAAAATHPLRDPLAVNRGVPPRADRPARGFGNGGLDLRFVAGPVVAATHPYFDTRLKYDPEWYGKKNRVIAGTTAESYASAQWRWVEVFFGRLDRNWGPSAAQGVMLSDSPYGMDHLGITLGTPGLQVQGYVTELDARTDTAGARIRRHLVLHRLWVRPSSSWTLSAWEASVLSGPERALEPWYLNLLNLAFLEQVNSGTNVNSFVGLDVEWGGRVTVFGQAMLDDIQVDRKLVSDRKPTSYALTVGAQGPFAVGAWSAYYTRVANLTYRNEDDFQVPLFHGVGTGRNFADYDQATLRLSAIVAGALVAPEVTLVRQGEGDPRLAHPLPPDYATTATLFEGVVERTLRLALGVRWRGGPVGIVADGGAHLVRNAGHQQGASRTRFVGSLGIELRFAVGGAAP